MSAKHFSPYFIVDTLEHYLDPSMTEWERGREQEEFFRAAMFYKSSNSTLSSRFTRAKYEDDVDKVEVPRDQEVYALHSLLVHWSCSCCLNPDFQNPFSLTLFCRYNVNVLLPFCLANF